MDIDTLFHIAREGDKEAEERLFRSLSVRIRVLAYQRIWNESDAEDVAQETLTTIAREYRAIEFETSFSAWARKVLDNRVLTYLKAKRARTGRQAPVEAADHDSKSTNPDPVLKSRLLDCLKEIGTVNRRYARILNLHYQGYTTDEVCTKLKVTQKHSYMVLSRARSVLKACLEKWGPIDV